MRESFHLTRLLSDRLLIIGVRCNGLVICPSRLPLADHPYIAEWRAHSLCSVTRSDHLTDHRPHVGISVGFPAGLGFLGNPSAVGHPVDTYSKPTLAPPGHLVPKPEPRAIAAGGPEWVTPFLTLVTDQNRGVTSDYPGAGAASGSLAPKLWHIQYALPSPYSGSQSCRVSRRVDGSPRVLPHNRR